MSRYRCEKCGEERASHKKTHDSKGIHAFNNYTCAPLNEVHPSANNGQRKFAMRYFEKIYWKRYIIRDAWHDTYELKKIHRGNVSICFMIMNTRKNIVLQRYVWRATFCFHGYQRTLYPFNQQTWKINVSWWIETRSRSKSVFHCFPRAFSRIPKLNVRSIDIVGLKLRIKIFERVSIHNF